jgi:hypothetical protein
MLPKRYVPTLPAPRHLIRPPSHQLPTQATGTIPSVPFKTPFPRPTDLKRYAALLRGAYSSAWNVVARYLARGTCSQQNGCGNSSIAGPEYRVAWTEGGGRCWSGVIYPAWGGSLHVRVSCREICIADAYESDGDVTCKVRTYDSQIASKSTSQQHAQHSSCNSRSSSNDDFHTSQCLNILWYFAP